MQRVREKEEPAKLRPVASSSRILWGKEGGKCQSTKAVKASFTFDTRKETSVVLVLSVKEKEKTERLRLRQGRLGKGQQPHEEREKVEDERQGEKIGNSPPFPSYHLKERGDLSLKIRIGKRGGGKEYPCLFTITGENIPLSTHLKQGKKGPVPIPPIIKCFCLKCFFEGTLQLSMETKKTEDSISDGPGELGLLTPTTRYRSHDYPFVNERGTGNTNVSRGSRTASALRV